MNRLKYRVNLVCGVILMLGGVWLTVLPSNSHPWLAVMVAVCGLIVFASAVAFWRRDRRLDNQAAV